uniref:SCP domain-containing protein n=1 Tax=Paramormyrops kingsleyae TaxID=1676925 RepID=A0A3B3R1I4_9TELE
AGKTMPSHQFLLGAQNQYRKRHGAEPLALNPALSKEAQEWAVQLVAPKRSTKTYGQSAWYHWGSSLATPTGTLGSSPWARLGQNSETKGKVADSWHKERCSASLLQAIGTAQVHHMMWKSSKKLGVGLVTKHPYFHICKLSRYYFPAATGVLDPEQ